MKYGIADLLGLLRINGSAGTDGQVLTSKGASTDPQWVTPSALGSVRDYGTSASASTTRTQSNVHICYGVLSVGGNSSASISNLPFTSASTYEATGTYTGSGANQESMSMTKNSGSGLTIYNPEAVNETIMWVAIGT